MIILSGVFTRSEIDAAAGGEIGVFPLRWHDVLLQIVEALALGY
jgi:hypothetical protein